MIPPTDPKPTLAARLLRRPELWLVLLGLALRLYIAFARTDAVWPDEQFQALEPASSVVFGHGLMSWEWQSGYRSWILPALYMPLLWVCKIVGLTGGSLLVNLARACMALVSAWVLLRFDALLGILRVSRGARLLGLAAFALSGPMVLWSVTTLADHWALIAAWGALPAILKRLPDRSRRNWLVIGSLCGLPLLCKIQMAAWVAGLGLAFLLLRIPVGGLAMAFLGVVADCLFVGLFDAVTLGGPFKSWLQQIAKGAEISRFYGTHPAEWYFPKIFEDQGALLFTVLGGLMAAWGAAMLLSLKEKGAPKDSSEPGVEWRWLLPVLLPPVLLVAFHCLIAHKEVRFLLPAFPALYVLLAAFASRFERWLRVPDLAIGLGALAVAGISLAWARVEPVYLTPVNVADLETAIYADGGLSPAGGSCVLLVGHNWSFTHGMMILGQKAEHIDVSPSEINVATVSRCEYAIIARDDVVRFWQVGLKYWQPMRSSKLSRFELFKRKP